MRCTLSILFVFLAVLSQARTVSLDEAKSVADQFLSVQTPHKHRSAKVVKRDKESSPYYIFNAGDDEGFVIVAGDTKARKVLGYSDKGSIDLDNLPVQLDSLLSSYSREIMMADPLAADDKSWKRDADTDEVVVLLNTAEWDQGDPYNLYCPEDNGQRALTGCSATSMGIVMKYYNWPPKGSRSNVNFDISTWRYERNDYSALELDWNLISDRYDENSSDAQKHEVSKLLKAAGCSIEWYYGLSYESAYVYPNLIDKALRTHFRYSPECEFVLYNNYDHALWEEMLRKELDEARPVVYYGYCYDPEQAFVCDGYTRDGLYHFNWGFGGESNGFFSLRGVGSSSGSYYKSGMVRGIKPQVELTEYSEVAVDDGFVPTMYFKNYYKGAFINVENVEKGEPFDFACSKVVIPTGFSGDYGVALVDGSGYIKEILASSSVKAVDRTSLDASFHDLIVKENEPGDDDYIQVVAKNNIDNKWLPALGTSETPSRVRCKGNKIEKCHVKINNSTSNGSVMVNGKPVGNGSYDIAIGSFVTVLLLEKDKDHLSTLVIDIDGEIYVRDNTIPDPLFGRIGVGLVLYGSEYEIDLETFDSTEDSVVLTEAGTLAKNVSIGKASLLTKLSLSGPIDAKDLSYIRSWCQNLRHLDISKATISATTLDGNTYEANTLPKDALRGLSKLEYVDLPTNLEAVGTWAFSYTNLKAIDIPQSVKELEDGAFKIDPTAIMVHWTTPPQINRDAFASNNPINPTRTLYVPVGTIDLYRDSESWGWFRNIEEYENFDFVPEEVVYGGIVYRLFPHTKTAIITGCREAAPKDIVIPQNILYDQTTYEVTAIEDEVFSFNQALESVVMPNSITHIGYRLFKGCENLKYVKLSEGITEIPGSCFANCNSLEEAPIPSNVKRIKGYAFYLCKSLKKIHIPQYAYLEYYAVSGLNSCTSVTVDDNNSNYVVIDNILYSENMKRIEFIAKEGDIIVPESVSWIDPYFLYGMDKVTSVRFEMRDNVYIYNYLVTTVH